MKRCCRQWTAEDDALLREHYPGGGVDGVLQWRPEWRSAQVRRRANELGLRVAPEVLRTLLAQAYARNPRCVARRAQMEAEAAVIRARFPEGGVQAVREVLPHLSRACIHSRTRAMGLQLSPEKVAELSARARRGVRAFARSAPVRRVYREPLVADLDGERSSVFFAAQRRAMGAQVKHYLGLMQEARRRVLEADATRVHGWVLVDVGTLQDLLRTLDSAPVTDAQRRQQLALVRRYQAAAGTALEALMPDSPDRAHLCRQIDTWGDVVQVVLSAPGTVAVAVAHG